MVKEGFAAPVFDCDHAYPVWSLPCGCARFVDAGGNYREEWCSFGARLDRLVEAAWDRHYASPKIVVDLRGYVLYEQRCAARDAHTNGLYDSSWTPEGMEDV